MVKIKPRTLWTIYIILLTLLAIDEVTTSIGLKNPNLEDKNKLIEKAYYINLALKIIFMFMLGLIIYYGITQINNIKLILRSG